MELMIACPLVLPDEPLDLARLEDVVRDWGRRLQQQALARAWAAQAPLRPAAPCPGCRGTDLAPAGHKPRRVETLFGPVRLPRQRVRCRGCGRQRQPADGGLDAASGRGRCTPALRELAASCGASWPYRRAARVLGRLRGSPLSAETMRAVVERAGAAVAHQHAAAAAAAGRPPAGAPATTRPRPDRLVVERDGAWVRSRGAADGMEAKVGVVHAGRERVGRRRTRLRERRYAATVQGVGACGPLVTAAAVARNGYEARQQTVLGDGAAWIWKLAAAILSEATPVLDRWHLADARRRALRQAVPAAAERAAWTERIEACLGTGDVPGAVAVLAELTAAAPEPAVAEFAAFLAEQAPRIPDYAGRRAAGQPIGSGGVEKGVDVTVNRRFQGRRGMQWGRARADGVLARRVAALNGEWTQRVPLALGPCPANLPAF